MSIHIAPRPAPPAPLKAGPLGPAAGILQSEYPLSLLLGRKDPRKHMKRAWALSYEVGWIAAAEDAICGRFSTVPWHLEDENDDEITDAYPNVDARQAKALLEFPSRALNFGSPYYRTDLWALTARAMGVCGSAFVLLDQPEALGGTPAAMVPIAPWRFWEQEDAAGNLIGWWVDRTDASPGIAVRLDEVLHYQLRRRFEGHFGIGLVESAMLKPELANALDRHLTLMLSGGGRMSGILSPKEGDMAAAGSQPMEQLERDWRTIVDSQDAAKRLQLVRYPVEFQKTTLSPQELQIRELMDGARDDLLALWGVPFTMIGGAMPAGLNSGDARKYDEAQVWQGPVHTRLNIFREVTQYQLLDRWSALGATVELEIEEPAFDDRTPNFELAFKALAQPLRNKERRELLGLDPLGGPQDEEVWLPATQVIAYAAPVPPETATKPQPTPVLGISTPTPQLLAAGETSGKAGLHDSLVKLRTNLAARITPRLTGSVQDALDEQKREVLARVRRHWNQIRTDPTRVSIWWDEAAENKRIRTALVGHLSGVADATSDHVNAMLAPGKAEDAVQRLLRYGVARVGGINATTTEALKQTLSEAVAADDLDAAIAAVESSTAFDAYRAERIARTELMFAYNSAALGSYQDAGINMVQAIDGDEDEVCASRNGREFPIAEAYGIEDHPNGTLDWVPVMV